MLEPVRSDSLDISSFLGEDKVGTPEDSTSVSLSSFLEEDESEDVFDVSQFTGGVPRPDSLTVEATPQTPDEWKQRLKVDPFSGRLYFDDEPRDRWDNALDLFTQSLTRTLASVPKTIGIIGNWKANQARELENLRREGLEGEEALPQLDPLEVETHPAYRFGKFLSDSAEEMFPGNPEFQDELIASVIPEMAGSLTAYVATGRFTQGLGAVGSAVATSALGSSDIASSEFERALAKGEDEETAFQTFLMNLPTGVLEWIPVGRALRRLDSATGGGVKQVLKQSFKGGIEELTTEVAQTAWANKSAALVYDDARQITEGLYEAGVGGGATGAILNGVAAALGARRARATTLDEYVELTDAGEEIGTTLVSPEGEIGDATTLPTLDPDQIDPDQHTLTLPKNGLIDRTVARFRKLFKPGGGLPDEAWVAKLNADGELGKEVARAQYNSNRLLEAVERVYGKRPPDVLYRDMNDALAGDPIKLYRMHEDVREILIEMRSHIDKVSQGLLDAGVVTGKLRLRVQQNMGVYLNRSYRKWDDPAWAEKVQQDPGLVNRAWMIVEQEMTKELGRKPTENEVNTRLLDILNPNSNTFGLIRPGKIGSKDLSILKERQNIHPAIRALMGEYQDPVQNYARTIERSASLLANGKFLQEVRDAGMGKFFFRAEDDRPPGFNEVFASEGSRTLAPLNGLYTTKEIKEAFLSGYQDIINSSSMKFWLGALSVVKYSKTIANPATHGRNIVGGFYFMMANGHAPKMKDVFAGIKVSKSNVVGSKGEFDQRTLERAIELGLVDRDTRANELYETLEDLETLFSGDATYGKRLRDRALKPVKFLANVYAAEDNVIRYAFWRAEYARMRDALPASVPDVQVEGLAATIVQRTYQDYANVPDFVKRLRRFPLVGTFASFHYEVVRTTIGTIQQAKEEMKSPNPKVRSIGYRRAMGLALTAGTISVGARLLTKLIWGVGDEEEDDLRRHLAPWDKNANLALFGMNDGKYRLVNVDRLDPYTMLRQPIQHLLFNDDEDSALAAIIKGMGESVAGLFGEDILAERLRLLMSNQNEYGSQIWNPQEDLFQKVAKGMAFLWQIYEPGVFAQAERTAYAAMNIPDANGRTYTLPYEIAAWGGLRITEVDISKSLRFKALDYKEMRRDAKRIFNSSFYDRSMLSRDVPSAYRTANQRFLDAQQAMSEDIYSAMRLGVSPRQVDWELEGAGLSKAEIKRLKGFRLELYDFEPPQR